MRLTHAVATALVVGILSAAAPAQGRYIAVPWGVQNAHQLTLSMAFGDASILSVTGGAPNVPGLLLVGFPMDGKWDYGRWLISPIMSFPFAFDANGNFRASVDLTFIPDGGVVNLQAVGFVPGCEDLSCLLTSNGLRLTTG